MANIIEFKNVYNQFDDVEVHHDISFGIERGEIFSIIGASGSGKTTLLRNMLMLLPPSKGTVNILGENIYDCSQDKAEYLRSRFGVLFQSGALFGSLTVLQNVMFPLKEFTKLPKEFSEKLALIKINMAGLPMAAANKYPSELSGGMIKRAATARAIVLDPEILFLDEPTSGLDPESREEFNDLVIQLHESLKLTVVMVSHDVPSIEKIANRVAFLGEGKLLALGKIDEVRNTDHPVVRNYFKADRALSE
jgi:phospholipid/cholesterol/gamma-HCH transport system ATP-binding protein